MFVTMMNLKNIHSLMAERRGVVLQDGRRAHVVRVDCELPNGPTTVTLYSPAPYGLALSEVDLEAVLGPADRLSA